MNAQEQRETTSNFPQHMPYNNNPNHFVYSTNNPQNIQRKQGIKNWKKGHIK